MSIGLEAQPHSAYACVSLDTGEVMWVPVGRTNVINVGRDISQLLWEIHEAPGERAIMRR